MTGLGIPRPRDVLQAEVLRLRDLRAHPHDDPTIARVMRTRIDARIDALLDDLADTRSGA